MAVYTDVPDDELQKFAAQYAIGEVISCKGIAEGVENSNYLLRAETGTFILTLYEKRVDPKDLPFFIALMEHLASRGLACPTPLRGRDGVALRRLCGRRRRSSPSSTACGRAAFSPFIAPASAARSPS